MAKRTKRENYNMSTGMVSEIEKWANRLCLSKSGLVKEAVSLYIDAARQAVEEGKVIDYRDIDAGESSRVYIFPGLSEAVAISKRMRAEKGKGNSSG